jgi:CXXC-20-CXXC protein
MAECPRCHTKQDYSKVFLLRGGRTLTCKQCGASLRLSKARMFPYMILVGFVAGYMGLTMMLSRHYLEWLVILFVWILICMALYPLVVSLRLSNDENQGVIS